MAGNYPDVPGPRMPYDRDGTAFVIITNGVAVAQSSTGALNSESASDWEFCHNPGGMSDFHVCFIFPEVRNLVGALWVVQTFQFMLSTLTLQTSADTTNGVDGTWTVVNAAFPTNYPGPVSATRYRTGIVSTISTGIRAVKIGFPGFAGTADLKAANIHLYGEIATGENPDRIRIWHPTLDQEVSGAYFDGGNIPRGSTADIQFRLKNQSATYTANNIVVSIEAPTDWSPSVPGQYTFSQGGSYTATQNVSSLAPGAISGLITMRRITPTNAALSLHALRIKAIPTTWT